jgi:hypothetical protein
MTITDLIINDLKYEAVIFKLEESGYVKTFYKEALTTEMSTGVGIIVLLQSYDGCDRTPDINYSTLNQILKNKPSDLLVADLERGRFQFMVLKSMHEKEKQNDES